MGRIVGWLLAAIVAAMLALAGWLYVAPPALIRVATAYSAKIVCSNVFLAGRDGGDVLAVDVQAPGHPLLRYITIDVDDVARTVSANLFGVFGDGRAVYRPGAGCTTIPAGAGGSIADLPALPQAGQVDIAALWPAGERVQPSPDPAIGALLDDAEMTGPGMRAVVVVKDGRVVGERYGEGFNAMTPLLGWSMTKTVTAAIIGTLVDEERLSLDQDGLFETWSADDRGAITIADLMAMSSGLAFNEDYGDVTDVTRMLYLEPDMAAFAADKPLAAPPGEVFSYSSGTTVMLSRIWQGAFDEAAAALAWPREALFGPLGMASAVLEPDAAGTLVGSSYLYATARDWARFGQFLLQEGRWEGRQILPAGYVAWMRQEAPASAGEYGRGQVWLHGPGGAEAEAGLDLPGDTFWLRGHDGQTIAVVPSQQMVIVRLGLTPSALEYRPQHMVAALVQLLAETNGSEGSDTSD
jgi:CubicO group peptidase (beta-lactamase class C family)